MKAGPCDSVFRGITRRKIEVGSPAVKRNAERPCGVGILDIDDRRRVPECDLRCGAGVNVGASADRFDAAGRISDSQHAIGIALGHPEYTILALHNQWFRHCQSPCEKAGRAVKPSPKCLP
jgi:hypothetical protein